MVWSLSKTEASREKGGPFEGRSPAFDFAGERLFLRDDSDGGVIHLLDSCCVKVRKRLPDGRHRHRHDWARAASASGSVLYQLTPAAYDVR